MNEYNERIGRFAAGFDDGMADKASRTGRSIAEVDPDYAFGYVAGRYEQIDRKSISTYNEAKVIWESIANCKR